MEQMSLFDDRGQSAPLATRLRPDSLEDFAGQEHLLGKGKILRQLIEKDQISSIMCGATGAKSLTNPSAYSRGILLAFCAALMKTII